MDFATVYEKMYSALDYLWKTNKDDKLEEYLKNANPYSFAIKTNTDFAPMTGFLQFLNSQYGYKDFTEEEAFNSIKKYISEELFFKENCPFIANRFENLDIQEWKEICRKDTSPKHQDYRLSKEEIELLHSMIGKKLEGYYSDDLLNSAEFTCLYFCAGEKNLLFENSLRPVYFLDEFDDNAVLSLNIADDSQLEKYTKNPRAKYHAVNKQITGFDLVTETLSVSNNSKTEYQAILTRGVIFHLEDGIEVAFEKGDDFEELIYIHEGINTSGKFHKTEIEYNDPFHFNYVRRLESYCCFKELDVVKTKVDKKLPRGTEGTIVHVYESVRACEIEFSDKNGCTLAIESYSFDEIELVFAYK